MEDRAQYAAAYLEISEHVGFTYAPLADASSDFRLLRVWPHQRNGRTQVEMWNVSSASAQDTSTEQPDYQCLSYTWGAPDEGHEIYLNGCPYQVRRNLSDFLRQAATSLQMQSLWIDALCINQDLVQEKNIQVTRMGSIYHRARAVLVWFGEDASLIPLARYMAHNDFMEHSADDSLKHREASFAAFWNHPYWTRTWITQELLVAQSIQVLIGPYSFAWSCIDTILGPGFRLTHKILPIVDLETKLNFHRLVVNRLEHSALTHQDIWELLRWRNDTECSITSDRIYALLSLVNDGATFRASYDEEPAILFWRVGHHFQAWSSVSHMQLLRVALRLTRHDIARSMRPTGSLVLELRAADAKVNLSDRRSSLCSKCGMDVVLGHKSDIMLCSNLKSTSTFTFLRPTHVLIQRQSKARSIVTSSRIKLVHNYALKVVYDFNAGRTKVDLSHRALTHRVGEDWKTSTPEEIESLRQNMARAKGHTDEQPSPERWAVFLPPDNVLHRLDAIQGGTSYPWWEERWADISSEPEPPNV